MKEARVVVLGAGGVGKSALTLRFVKRTFQSTYDPTIEETYEKHVELDGQPALVQIMDTAGTEQFTALKELYMRTGDGFLLVFSLAQLASVNELGALREQIVRVKNRARVPLVIVGNKADLREDRQVPREIGTNLSRSWGNVPYYETSARKGVNVEEAFHDVVRQCRSLGEAEQTGTQRTKGRKKGCSVM